MDYLGCTGDSTIDEASHRRVRSPSKSTLLDGSRFSVACDTHLRKVKSDNFSGVSVGLVLAEQSRRFYTIDEAKNVHVQQTTFVRFPRSCEEGQQSPSSLWF
jgi:hypothetical protein